MGWRFTVAALAAFSVAGLTAQGIADHKKSLRLRDEALLRDDAAEAAFQAAEELWSQRHHDARESGARVLRAAAARMNREADLLFRAEQDRAHDLSSLLATMHQLVTAKAGLASNPAFADATKAIDEDIAVVMALEAEEKAEAQADADEAAKLVKEAKASEDAANALEQPVPGK
jgi:hypothetical protein